MSVNHTHPLWPLLAAYVSGSASPDERAAVAAAAQADPEIQQILDRLLAVQNFQLPEGLVSTSDMSVQRDRLMSRIKHEKHHRQPRGALTRKASLGVAAAAMAMVGVLALPWTTHSARQATVYTASTAEQKTITLPDGSTAQLAPQSKLTVANGFGERARAVELTGEAHFSVTTSSGAPFLVRSARITSRVLGTEFTVKYFDGDKTVQVAVVSGKIGSLGVRSVAITTAGKISNLTDSTAVTTDAGHQTAYTDWSRGQLIFNAAPISDMLATLGRWYGYEFKWSDATLSSGRVSGTFKVADRADMIVVLSAVLDVTMTVDGKIITLHPRRTMHAAPVKSYEHFTSPTEIGR